MNREQVFQYISDELKLKKQQVANVVQLLEEGNTIPFIARYRKEQTGELDEESLRLVEERFQYISQLNKRKDEVTRLIDEQGKLTDALSQKIQQVTKLQELEDIYLPFRPKRKTRATMAKEKGLEPLAKKMQEVGDISQLKRLAVSFINPERDIATAEDALAGATDIIAEEIAEDAKVRKWIREFTWETGILISIAKNAEQSSVYEMYYDYQEKIRQMPSHRVLAVFRGEREEILKVKISVEKDQILPFLFRLFSIQPHSYLEQAAEDGYKRLIAPAIEREMRAQMLEKAEEKAIHVFSENLRQLLLQPPIQNRVVLGVDPAYRTGCKLAVVDETGKLLKVDVIYPTPPQNKIEEAKQGVLHMIHKYGIDFIVIGNGTASRETEAFIADVMKEVEKQIYYVIANEAGASVYSASKLAREEFPDLDVAERSAISIARRLQDPLAELVKIDPKSVGVGQYQHDVSQKKLSQSLKNVVESAVNYVGIDVNTASVELLTYVSGLTSAVAKNIVKRREELGKFKSRKELKEIPRLGNKTFEQCAGFLRIYHGDHYLDQTPIHPESYQVVQQLFSQLNVDTDQIEENSLRHSLKQLPIEEMAETLQCGVPTLRDIVESLLRPGRDPRDEMPAPLLRSDILQLEDLRSGMRLQGTVRNVVDFGAFVDIGLKNEGLVHISKMSEHYVKNPLDIVSVGDIVDVWVMQVDVDRQRVGLSMIPLGNQLKEESIK